MATTDQKKRLLKAKIAVALHDELGRVPTYKEIEQVFLLTRVTYKAVLGLHYRRKEQQQTGQLAIFSRRRPWLLLRPPMLIGYARVSTLDQTLALQHDALTQAGCERIFTDTLSGSRTDRPGLDEALDFLRPGDTLVVW